MLNIDRRLVLTMIAAGVLSGPALALDKPVSMAGVDATPAGFKGKIFINERGGVRLHTYVADPEGMLVTSTIVETGDGLVLIDGQFMPANAGELKSYIDMFAKPVVRAILTHGHPDHWFGFSHAGVKDVHAGPITAKFIAERGAALISERKVETTVPNIVGTLQEGEETIGGVTFRFGRVLDTEAPEIFTIGLPAAGALITSDLVYNNVHAVVSKQIDQWVAVLKLLEAAGGQTPILVPGHGEPAGPEMLPAFVTYLEAIKPLLLANAGKEDQAKAVAAEMARQFPDRRIPALLTLGLSRALKI